MLKIQIHVACYDGRPIPGTGDCISGKDPLEIVEALKMRSPFTADMQSEEYIKSVRATFRPEKTVYPEENLEKTAGDFLQELAKFGFISFLPTEETPDSQLQTPDSSPKVK